MRLGLVIFSLLIITPTITLANIGITEIMYDLEGSDSKREWIELYNGGSTSVDLTDWVFNDGANHNLVGDDLVIEGNSYALLVSDIETYGTGPNIIDTVMSLTNTSKTISILDPEGLVADSVTYISEWGGSGNGNSLQLVNGNWTEGAPTPLGAALGAQPETPEDEPQDEGPDNNDQSETQEEPKENEQAAYASYFVSNIKASAGEDRIGIASAIMFFEGEALGLEDKPLKNARYVWNFGDGKSKEGKNVAHTYSYVGEYIVSLNVSSGEHSASDRILVNINEADLDIVSAGRDKIEVANNSNKELELSYWSLKYKDNYFMFPKGTFILPKHTAIFPSSVTELSVENLNEVSLLYPNGIVAKTFLSSPIQNPTKEVVKEEVVEYVYVTKKVEVERNEAPEQIVQEEQTRKASTSASTLNTATLQNALVSESAGSQSMYKWLIALVSLISVASLVAVSYKSPQRMEKDGNKLNADDFKIKE